MTEIRFSISGERYRVVAERSEVILPRLVRLLVDMVDAPLLCF